jgi:hypothetical protein
LKFDQCYGCKKYTKQSSNAFEVEYEYMPKVKVEPPKQIEIAKPKYELVKINPESAKVARQGDKNEGS